MRRNPFWIWLWLVFCWYSVHGYIATPSTLSSKYSMRLILIALIGLWTIAWTSWWIWVWPIAVLATLTAACLLGGLAAMATVLAQDPSKISSPAIIDNPTVRFLWTAIVLWAVAMKALGEGAAVSLKKRF